MVVEAIKSKVGKSGSRFKLRSKSAIFSDLETDYFADVFNNTTWSLSVRFVKDTDIDFSKADISTNPGYKVLFNGYRYEADVLLQEFSLSSSISNSDYQSFYSSDKNIFIGADRTGISGSVTTEADARSLSLRFWNDALTEEELKDHASNLESIARQLPTGYKELSQHDSALKSDSLILNWQFDAAETNSENNVIIQDASSGSADNVSKYGAILGHKYPAKNYRSRKHRHFNR